jgi:methyl-accepting chemotaxis protein-1 (serine sensor receptor)
MFAKMNPSQMSVRQKLVITMVLLGLLVLGGLGLGLTSVWSSNRTMELLHENEMGGIVSMLEARDLAFSTFAAIQSSLASRSAAIAQENAELVESDLARLDQLFRATAQRTESDQAGTLIDQIIAARATFAQVASEAINSMGGAEYDRARFLVETRLEPAMTPLLALTSEYAEYLSDRARERHERAVLIGRIVLAVSILAVILLIGAVVAMVRSLGDSIRHSVHTAVEVADRIASGELGHEIGIDSNNELSELLHRLADMDRRIAEIVSEILDASMSVRNAASEISQGNEDLAQRTQQQASSLEETASTMEQMTASVKQNADNASQANQLAKGARGKAEAGGDVVRRTIEAMQGISDSSERISAIIGTIDEIAFQTNLLALNAAVEAARAGEQGRGFSVVAAEVRSLAQRSAAAAKEIKGLITDSVHRVETGSELVDESGKTLEDIVASVKQVAEIVAEISAASYEQSAGIEEVNRAVSQMDEVTQRNAALVEEAAAASRALEEQALQMTEKISYFRIEGGAVSTRASSGPVPPPRSPSSSASSSRSKPAAPPAQESEAVWEEF